MISECVHTRGTVQVALVALCKDEPFVWLSLINDMHLSCVFEEKKDLYLHF
jgi:hypothetical protein